MQFPQWSGSFPAYILLPLVLLLSACNTDNHNEPVSAPPALTLATVLPKIPCVDLMNTDLTAIGGDGSHISDAKVSTHNGTEVCEIDGLLAPEIGFKVLLPTQNWTQRYLQLGCGGLCGLIMLDSHDGSSTGCVPANRGEFVLATTDMGHSGFNSKFGHQPQQRIDFAHRAVHLTSLAAKRLIAQFYGQEERYAYFSGCSDGGREALMEAQRYPKDFDGILAGAPALNFTVQNSFYHGWQALSNIRDDGSSILTAAQLPILHQAVLKQCDALDGLEDGLITDPRQCHFDPGLLVCEEQQTQHCLTTEQAETARKLYQGPVDATTGVALSLGGPMPGSERYWEGVFVPTPWWSSIRAATMRVLMGSNFSASIATDAIRDLIYPQTLADDYDLRQFEFSESSFKQAQILSGLYNASNPDLSEFHHHKGKLILWHGWSDPHISPINTIAYYESMQRTLGEETSAEFTRLYLIPGMNHCEGGEGPHQFDLLTALMDWVETDHDPQDIIAYQSSPTERSQPLYPYPLQSRYVTGNPDLATSYSAYAGMRNISYPWAGEELYRTDITLDCEVSQPQGRDELTCRPPSNDKPGHDANTLH